MLWLIYHLEQQAKTSGGVVHFIIGNHEIKNLQGNFKSASDKYLPIVGILGKQQYGLFSDEALIGRWLASKNVIEKINGYVFTHGGIHPDTQNLEMTLDEINQLARAHYRDYYYPSNQHFEAQKLLLSTNTGPAWYRGYFKGELSQQQIESSLAQFDANTVQLVALHFLWRQSVF